MPTLHTGTEATYLMQIFTAAFLSILFLQSGIDKIVDRRGNFEWLKGHVGKSPLAELVRALLTIITILELAAGAVSLRGFVHVIFFNDQTIIFCVAMIAMAVVLQISFSERMAQDYEGPS